MKIQKLSLIILGVLVVTFSHLASGATIVTKMQLTLNKKITRFSFTLNGKSRVKSFPLSKPARWVVDFSNTKLTSRLPPLNLESTIIKSIRTARRKRIDLRMVFDLKKNIAGKVRFKKIAGSSHYLLTIEFPTHDKSVRSRKTKWDLITNQMLAKIRAQDPKRLTPAVQVPLQRDARDVIVVIDPGHGGHDPGAIGRRGTKEKHVVLAISRELYRLVNKTPGMRARLTRSKDYYISLRERLRRARKYNADVFVAIHADAYRNRRAHGSSVYTVSQRGASSEAARWLAEKENYSELGGVNLDDKSNLLRSVLIDLSQTATIGASLKLGASVLYALRGTTRLHRHRVEQAPFVVLKSPDIPSVLVETGFISNRSEEKRLKSKKYQKKIAQAILNGVQSYFHSHAPPGSLISLKQRAQKYVVMRGETLSFLADRFGVSIQELSRFNGFSVKARLHAGQVIVIPPHEGTDYID